MLRLLGSTWKKLESLTVYNVSVTDLIKATDSVAFLAI